MKTIALAAASLLALGAATAATAETHGPDSFGYVATDQVNYTFNDITATGTKILVNYDDAVQTITLPFTFNFYGAGYTAATLSTNGNIQFGSASNAWTNGDLTQGQQFGGATIYTFWDDLWTRGADNAGIYYQTIGDTPGSRKFVVQEIANSYQIGGSVINFQTVLDEATGDILMRYTQTAFGSSNFDGGASATVGIQGNQSLGQTLQWSFNSPVLHDNQSLCFTRNANAACNAIVDAPAVPEPATWAMMTLGFGAMGLMLRRRKAEARIRFA